MWGCVLNSYASLIISLNISSIAYNAHTDFLFKNINKNILNSPDMTIHEQRVVEMSNFNVDYYSKLAFKSMTEWFPQYKRGIESSKFMKVLRNMNIFPDIKRPQRVSQLDLMFLKECNSENGINDKYVLMLILF